MSVSKQWQLEINMVWQELSKRFDFWTDSFCGFHVHVSPGPTRQNRYTLDQIVRVAKGAYFWEDAICHIIPDSRSWNQYAKPNCIAFAMEEFTGVPSSGWSKVFSKIDGAATTQPNLVDTLSGGWKEEGRTANLSTNFIPVEERGTIALRRQAGVASAMSTIRGILLAVTLYISALRYDFDKAASRKDYPESEELIRELAGCIKRLPETCHGTRFVHWLKWCHESYGSGKIFTEPQINIREEAFRKGLPPPDQRPYHPRSEHCGPEAMALPAYALLDPTAGDAAPQARQGTTPAAQGRGGASARGGRTSGRGGAVQGSSAPSRTSVAQDGRGGAASARGGGAGGRGGAAPATQGRRGGAATGGGRGGGSAGTTRPPATSATSASAGAPTRPPAGARSGGGTTTRLPEHLAASSSSRPVASSGNANTITTTTTVSAAGQRRRQQGEGA